MKKFYSALLVISFFFVFTISAHAKSIAINGSDGMDGRDGHVNYYSGNYKNAKEYKIGPASINQTEIPVTDLEINWVSGNITVIYHNKNTIKLSEKSKKELNESERLHYLVKDGKLTVQFCKSKYKYEKCSKDLIITLPENFKFESLTLNATSTSFVAEKLYTENFNANITSGEISTSLISNLENLNANLTSGTVSITAPYAENVNLNSTNGEISLTLTKQAPESIHANATSGSLNFTIPENNGFKLSVNKTSGSFRNSGFSFSEIDDDTYYYGNSQKRKYTINVTSGEIVLKKF